MLKVGIFAEYPYFICFDVGVFYFILLYTLLFLNCPFFIYF